MNLKFKELDIVWPHELSIFDLKNYILSKLREHGDPLRWAITSITTHSEKKIQVMSIEVVLIINKDKEKLINPELN